MRKYTLLMLAAAALAFSIPASAAAPKKAPASKAPAAPAAPAASAAPSACKSADELAAQPPVMPYVTLTGDALRAYIDAFNKVVGGHQPYDFDRLDIYHPQPGQSVWVLVKAGCVAAVTPNVTLIHDAIMELLHQNDI